MGNKIVLLTNGKRFQEITENAWRNSADKYKEVGFNQASEEQVKEYLSAKGEIPEVKEVTPKGSAKQKNKDKEGA